MQEGSTSERDYASRGTDSRREAEPSTSRDRPGREVSAAIPFHDDAGGVRIGRRIRRQFGSMNVGSGGCADGRNYCGILCSQNIARQGAAKTAGTSGDAGTRRVGFGQGLPLVIADVLQCRRGPRRVC